MFEKSRKKKKAFLQNCYTNVNRGCLYNFKNKQLIFICVRKNIRLNHLVYLYHFRFLLFFSSFCVSSSLHQQLEKWHRLQFVGFLKAYLTHHSNHNLQSCNSCRNNDGGALLISYNYKIYIFVGNQKIKSNRNSFLKP